MKKCSRCKQEKLPESFYSAKSKTGLSSRCKECSKIVAAEFYAAHSSNNQKIIASRKNKKALSDARIAGLPYFVSTTPCKNGHTSKRLVSTQQCCQCLKERKKRLSQSPDKIPDQKRSMIKIKTARNMGLKHYFTGLECVNGHISKRLVSTRQCVECIRGRKGKKKTNNESRNYQRANSRRRKPEARAKRRIYQSEILYNRSSYRLTVFMRSSLKRVLSLSEASKSSKTADELGYSKEKLKQRIEFGFFGGMNWSNYGDWHIDHAIPIIHFIRKGEERPKIINALCNLRPMWAKDNLSKGANHPKSQVSGE